MPDKKILFLARCGLFAALLCIFGPLSIPIGPIPVSLTGLVLYFSVVVLTTKEAVTSCAVYLLLGIVGLPVFSGYSGGIAKLLGPTGGYLVGYLFLVTIAGIFISLTRNKGKVISFAGALLGMILGTAVSYTLGTAWFVFQSGTDWAYALSVCVYPFIAIDLGKMVVANIVGRAVRIPLEQAGFLERSQKATPVES